MTGFRGLLQAGISVVCIAIIGAGLYLSSAPAGRGVVLDRPGTPARLVSDHVTATAFFEVVGDELELTMLFSERDAGERVVRSRVRLVDGQRHSVVVGEGGRGGPKRFVFRRVGYTVEMRLDPAVTLDATLGLGG